MLLKIGTPKLMDRTVASHFLRIQGGRAIGDNLNGLNWAHRDVAHKRNKTRSN
jgi:hypothetical protein